MADWKKRLLRVKQKAGQTLGGAEKTEVLTDDLHSLEKWVENVKTVCHNSHKRVKECLHTSASTDKEKKLKKLPEYMLSAQLLEASTSLTQIKEDTLMGQLMKTCGDAQAALASECLEYEANVEAGVLAPLQQLTEQDIPSIQKTRRNLSKLVLDMDMAKTRYHSAVKQQSTGSMPPSKVDAIREELEDTQSKVQSCKDQLSTDMYRFAAGEQDYSRFLLTLVEAQAKYHRNALKHLEGIIPDMQKECDCHSQTPAYGTPLEEHLRRVNREVATVLEDCIVTLNEFGLDEEGLYRIAGGASKVKKLKAAFDAGLVDMEDFITDVHSIAGAMKLYLRELPEPLMTYQLYDEWMAAAHLGHEERMQKLWLLCDRLPKPNFDNLRYLIKFLAKLAENSEVNKMSPSNIAIVIGPNLIWPPGDGGPSVLTTTTQSAIVESLILHADYFFPGDIHFDLSSASSDKGTPPGTLNAAPPGMYPNLEDMVVISAPSLSPSASDHAFQPDSITGVSPRAARKNKRAAPPPPGGEKSGLLRSNAPSPLVNLEKPPTSEKPQVSPAGHRSPAYAYADRANQPERPLGPPPAPPKPTSPGAISTGSVGYDANTGSGNAQAPLPSPARPNKPPVPHDKPFSMHTEHHSKLGTGAVLVDQHNKVSTSTVPGSASASLSTHITPAYDNVASLPYGPKPPEATSAANAINSASNNTIIANESSVSVFAQPNSSALNDTSGSSGKSNSLSRNSNSLPRNANKPPRPPRPVTMVSKEGKSTDNEITESTEASSVGSERKKPSISEETYL